MNDTKEKRSPGRPRRFDPAQAVETAQTLFHAQGYDAVSLAGLTGALGINPPSFYASFGSKHGLFTRVLDRYAGTKAIPFAQILREGRPVVEGLRDLLQEAARRYSADPVARGCLVMEGTHSNDPQARAAACAFQTEAEAMIRAFVAVGHPEAADRITDFVATFMAGLSDKAREGHDLNRLMATVQLALRVLEAELSA